MPCTTRESSTSPPRGPPPSRTSPTPLGSACGAPVIFRLRRGPNSWRRWKAAASRPWKCWPAI
jgi:hypothetical protein